VSLFGSLGDFENDATGRQSGCALHRRLKLFRESLICENARGAVHEEQNVRLPVRGGSERGAACDLLERPERSGVLGRVEELARIGEAAFRVRSGQRFKSRDLCPLNIDDGLKDRMEQAFANQPRHAHAFRRISAADMKSVPGQHLLRCEQVPNRKRIGRSNRLLMGGIGPGT
jgi:hypothetical protein